MQPSATLPSDFNVLDLRECPQHLPILAEWFHGVWLEQRLRSGEFHPTEARIAYDERVEQLKRHLTPGTLPVSFLAFSSTLDAQSKKMATRPSKISGNPHDKTHACSASPIAAFSLVNLTTPLRLSSKSDPWLTNVFVHEAYRGLGIGTGLLDAANHRAASMGYTGLRLYTLDAENFYCQRGWHRVGALQMAHQPMVIMERSIRASC